MSHTVKLSPTHFPTARCFALAATLACAFIAGCGTNPYPYRVQGNNAMIAGRYDEAVTAYKAYLDIKPGEPDMRAALGQALLKNNQPREAIEALRIATLQDPETESYIDRLAEAYIASNRTDDAIRYLKTNTVDNGRVSDWLRLGKYSSLTGDNDLAQQALRTAARIDGGKTPGPQIALHDLALKLGDKKEADSRLRMAYYCDPQDSEVVVRMRAAGVTGGPGFGFVPSERLKP